MDHDPNPDHLPQRVLGADDAVTVMSALAAHPAVAEILALSVDREHRCLHCLVVEEAERPDDVMAVAAWLAALGGVTPVAKVVLVSRRPGGAYHVDDAERWYELTWLLADAGIELLDWFVGDDDLTVAVSAIVGEVPNWRPQRTGPDAGSDPAGSCSRP